MKRIRMTGALKLLMRLVGSGKPFIRNCYGMTALFGDKRAGFSKLLLPKDRYLIP
jgi:hypothetical protein